MSKFQESVMCDGCGAEIRWSPITKAGRSYCCEDCSNGLPCDCATRQEPDEEGYASASSTTPPTDLI